MVIKKRLILVFSILFLIGILGQVSAVYVEDNLTIANMGHAIRVQSIETVPSQIAPGGSGVLKMRLINNAKFYLDDLIVELNLPAGITVLNDVNNVKRSRLNPLEPVDIVFNIIVSPETTEGVYDASTKFSYVSYLSALNAQYPNVGEEKTENNTFSIIVKDTPKIFEIIESTTIYKGNYLGEVSVKLVNNGVGNIKFLTIELLNSEDYDILSEEKKYIGDLDSDDFDSADFRIRVNNKENPNLLLKLTYKDALNQDYNEDIPLVLDIKTAEELGIATNGTSKTIGILIILGIIGYLVYRRFRKKKKRVIEL
ncbi:MAG: hypothetical protein WCX73_04395 [Candidatus Pacearchaeota archaeon]